MSFKSTLKACSQKASLYMLSVLFIAGLTFPTVAMADMLPPNWDKMSKQEQDAYNRARSERNRRRMEALNKELQSNVSSSEPKQNPSTAKSTKQQSK